jgi:hypothetical protein
VQADKVVPGMPSSYLIQDYLVFSDNNVVTLKFLPFDTKNVPAGMNPPVQMGDLAQPWRFRLYLWSQEQPPISINKEIDVDYETAGELMLQVEEPKMRLDIKWAFPDDRVIVTVIASENPQVDRVVIDPMDKDGNWISGGKVTRQAEYDDARPQRVVHTWEQSKEDWQRLHSFRIVPVYGTYVDLEKNSLEFKRDNLMR